MNFEDFQRRIEKDFNVAKTEKGTLLVSRDGRVAEVVPRERCSYDDFLRFFEGLPRGAVGHDDLHPSGLGVGDPRPVRGSLVDPGNALFGERPLPKDDDVRFPRFARFDPLVPSKDRKRGFDPDPDHLRPPGPDRGGLF